MSVGISDASVYWFSQVQLNNVNHSLKANCTDNENVKIKKIIKIVFNALMDTH